MLKPAAVVVVKKVEKFFMRKKTQGGRHHFHYECSVRVLRNDRREYTSTAAEPDDDVEDKMIIMIMAKAVQ